MKHIGTIKLSELAIITDPSYEYPIWCNMIQYIKPGNYNCFISRNKKGDRISRLEIIHEDTKQPKKYTCIGSVGVDSGQMGIFDKDYYIVNQPDNEWENPKSWYRRVCSLTLSNEECGVIEGFGVVSRSGYGDGIYPVYVAKDKNKDIIGIRIMF